MSPSNSAVAPTPDTRHPTRCLRITVEDHGPGIPSDVREHIFEPFFTTKHRSEGAGSVGKGLGLFVSHAVVQEHEGVLSVESEVGKWTRFSIELPVSDVVATETQGAQGKADAV